MGCVYIVERDDGSAYIGKTVKSLAVRMGQHISAANRGEDWAFYRAYRKHGSDAWTWRVLFESASDPELIAAEIRLIASYRAAGVRLYNSTDGGQGTSGRPQTVQARAKIAAKRRGKKLSAAHCAAISASQTHAPMSPETRLKMADAKRDYWARRRAAGLSMKHSTVTAAGRAVLSANAIARWAKRRETGAAVIGKSVPTASVSP